MKNGLPVHSYIVRIYRTGKNGTSAVVGVVERVGTTQKRSFTTIHELWEILKRSKLGRQHPSKGSGVH